MGDQHPEVEVDGEVMPDLSTKDPSYDIDGGASPPLLESPALTFAMCPGRRRCRSPPTSTYTARTSALTVRPRFVRAVYDLFLLRGDALLAAAAKR